MDPWAEAEEEDEEMKRHEQAWHAAEMARYEYGEWVESMALAMIEEEEIDELECAAG